MGSDIELNDTLQITTQQGFPRELDLAQHMRSPIRVQDFDARIFEFQGKPGLRVYHAPPVRNFLVHNVDGKWIYWGLIHITELHLNYSNRTTSGKFRLLYLYTPDEMQAAHDLIDRNSATKYAGPLAPGAPIPK